VLGDRLELGVAQLRKRSVEIRCLGDRLPRVHCHYYCHYYSAVMTWRLSTYASSRMSNPTVATISYLFSFAKGAQQRVMYPQALFARSGCLPSTNSSTILAQKAGRSSGLRLEMRA
jgi:hypothetical protein